MTNKLESMSELEKNKFSIHKRHAAVRTEDGGASISEKVTFIYPGSVCEPAFKLSRGDSQIVTGVRIVFPAMEPDAYAKILRSDTAATGSQLLIGKTESEGVLLCDSYITNGETIRPVCSTDSGSVRINTDLGSGTGSVFVNISYTY